MRKQPVNRRKSPMRGKKPLRYYMTTFITVCLLVLIQMILFVVAVFKLSEIAVYINFACRAISFFVIYYIVNRKYSASYKLAWCVPILLFPAVGGLAYVIARSRQAHRKFLQKSAAAEKTVSQCLPALSYDESDAEHICPKLSRYLSAKGYSGYGRTEVTYFRSGEQMYRSMLQALESAKKFIFLEFFIIHEGTMWDTILEILRRKVKEGVDVRVMYDGMGSVKCLPMQYDKKLRAEGIKTRVFHPFVPVISTMQNNRDHKKIVVVDGTVGYTGGINISDEYIGVIERFGKWKDSGILLTGDGVMGLTRIFLEMWYLEDPPDKQPAAFFTGTGCTPLPKESAAFPGYVIPYADTPMSEDNLGQNVYLDVISAAHDYLYIMTPYFIPGEAILNALRYAAESGVDVRIITPHIADKTVIHAVTRSYYGDLLDAGVKVYEYTPGFIHSKVFVCDDKLSTVGTVNLDYRSLYLHFECGAVLCGKEIAKAIREDFLDTLTSCTEITQSSIPGRSPFSRLFIGMLRLFEPLL